VNQAQSVVAGSSGEKCGLKYVIHSPGDQPKLQMNMFTLSNGIMQVWFQSWGC